MTNKPVSSFAVPLRADLCGDAVQVVAHALAEATLRGRGSPLTEDAVTIEASHHLRQAIEIVDVFPWYEPKNAELLAKVDRIDGALCNYINACCDPFEPVSEWDEESDRNFRHLCDAYTDWHAAEGPDEGEIAVRQTPRMFWKCPRCHGTGREIISNTAIRCLGCDGTGNGFTDGDAAAHERRLQELDEAAANYREALKP